MNQPNDPGPRGECCLKREKDLVKAVFILYTLNEYIWFSIVKSYVRGQFLRIDI